MFSLFIVNTAELFFSMLVLLFALFARCDIPPSERAVFVDLCTNTNIETYNSNLEHLNWCTSANICDWQGVDCNGPRTTVLSLKIVASDEELITGVLPHSFAALTNLNLLWFENVATTATLTQQFVGFNAHVFVLVLIGVPISGTFSFDRLPASVSRLLIQNTQITGPLVGNLNRFGSFRLVVLEGPGFVGTLPANLFAKFDASESSQLSVTNTLIGGELPDEMCATNCVNLVLRNNRFTDRPLCLESKIPGSCNLSGNLFCEGPRVEDGECIVSDPALGVFDQCFVCSGNGQSCVDCEGTPFGTKTYDVCEVCGGTTAFINDCPPDCAGTPHGTATYDGCDVCNGNGASCKDCAGVANGPSMYDVCDVCNGNGESCIDCLGILLGTSSPDVCDVCNGDGTSCLDCNGVPNGPSAYDQCDVCSGDNTSCSDCAGTPYGTKAYDRCDVCGGDGTLCGLTFIVNNSQTNTILIVIVAIVLVILLPMMFIAILYRRTTRVR